MTGYRLRGFHTLTLCMRKIVHFTALCKTRHLILWFIFFLQYMLIHHANSFFWKKNIVDTTNIDHWSPTFTFFDWSRVQKDALFKALNSETVYLDPANYTLLGSQQHITLYTRLGPIRECPHPPSLGHTRVFCPTCIHSMWAKSLIWAKAKMQSNKKKLREIN